MQNDNNAWLRFTAGRRAINISVSENARATPGSACQRLRRGQPVLSLGIRHARTSDIARMAATAGYDVIWIDLEHSSMSIDCAAAIAATATDIGIEAWVRVPEDDYGTIGRVLDCGATGMIFPKVEDAAQATRLASACRFPPEGQRSSLARLPHYGFATMPATDLMARANAGMTVQILIESRKGIANIYAIAAVGGVDIIAIGTNDLTAEFGCPGDVSSPEFDSACRAVTAACARHGKIAAVGGVADAAHFTRLLDNGFAPLIFAGIDTDIMAMGLADRTADWRARFAPAT